MFEFVKETKNLMLDTYSYYLHGPTGQCIINHLCAEGIYFVFGQVALVYGQMNEPPGARARVALTGLTVAEYFR